MTPAFHLRRFVAPHAGATPASHPTESSRALPDSLRVEHADEVALLGDDDLVRPSPRARDCAPAASKVSGNCVPSGASLGHP